MSPHRSGIKVSAFDGEAISVAIRGRRIETGLLALLFFLSGCAGLIFENVWFRQIGLVLGNSVWATSLVLASFMGGLALGNALAARWGDRLQRPLAAYAVMEMAVALTGAGLVLLLPQLPSLIAPLFRAVEEQHVLQSSVRLGISFFLLSIPTAAMGLTLPVLVRSLVLRNQGFGPSIGRLYGWNTAGAVAGVLLVESVLVPRLGIRGAGFFAAGLAAAVAAGAAALSRGGPSSAGREPRSIPDVRLASRRMGIFGAAFLSGAILLGLEVLWFRILLLFAPGTAMNFAVMLALVLAGIAGGGLAASVWLSKDPAAFRHARSIAALAGAATVGSYLAFGAFLDWQGIRYADHAIEVFRLASPLVLPPSLLSGILFTLIAAALASTRQGSAQAAGQATLANTLGGAIGSLVVAFGLLPVMGVEKALFGCAAAYGLVALMTPGLALRPVLRPHHLAPVLLGLVLVAFPHGRMREHVERSFHGHVEGRPARIAAVREGLTETLGYLEHLEQGQVYHRQLITNSISMSATSLAARRYMKLYVYLPVALHPAPRKALLISYGVGSTAKALTDTRELTEIDIVDTSRDIVEMSRINFDEPDEWPLADPRVRVHIEDGRHFLLTSTRQYDIITGEPPPPKLAGVANLYSEEYFRLVRERLAPGGFVTYWLPLHDLEEQDVRTLVRAFCNVFPDGSLWLGAESDWMLVGTRDAEGPVSAERVRAQWNDPRVRAELIRVGLERPEQLGALFLAGAEDLARLTNGTLPLRDNWPGRLLPLSRVRHVPRHFVSLLDTAQATFASSPAVRRLWPEELRAEALAMFPYQRIEDHLYWQKLVSGPAVVGLAEAHYVLMTTDLTVLPLRLIGSDPDLLAIAERLDAAGQRSPWVLEHLAAAAFARRDFENAADLAVRSHAADSSRVIARRVHIYALCRLGRAPDAGRLLAAGPDGLFSPNDRMFLEAEFLSRANFSTTQKRMSPPTR